VVVFEEIAGLVIKHSGCKVTKELQRVLAGWSLLIAEWLGLAGNIHHVEQIILCDGADLPLLTSILGGRGMLIVVCNITGNPHKLPTSTLG
jgi:hypothetical protein